jgi:hypothetical protein
MPTNEDDHHVFVLRTEHQNEWVAKAKAGNDAARLCLWAAEKFTKGIPDEPSFCGCCDTGFSRHDSPRAFIILIPVKEDPDTVRAHAAGVCVECSRHDDKWLIDQGVRRDGLAPTPPRSSDRTH